MTTPVIVVTPDFPPAFGGIQRVVQELARALALSRPVTVVAPADPAAASSDPLAPHRVRRTRAAWGGAGSAAVLAEAAALLARDRDHAILAAHAMMLPAVRAAGRRTDIALLYGSELWDPRARLVLRAEHPRVGRFVAISEFTRRQAVALGVAADRIDVVALGADEPVRPADAEDRLTTLGLVDDDGVRPFLLTVGRLAEPHKGQDAVLRALPALSGCEPRLRYVLAGDGPLRAHLERVAATSGAAAAVFAGRVDEETKAALLHECRALIMVSREARAAAQFEGFGLVYLEAALAGRASVAARAGAAPEVVADGETGLLVQPDSPAAIADATLRLLDPDLADRLGAEARRRARAGGTWAHARERLFAAVAPHL